VGPVTGYRRRWRQKLFRKSLEFSSHIMLNEQQRVQELDALSVSGDESRPERL
jgi:hypothetical protein